MNKTLKIGKNILFCGGGTGGSVTPLLAVAEELWHENQGFDQKLIFVGNYDGPEREMVAAFNANIGKMKYIPLISGKWRRYFSLQNFFDIFKIIIAYFQSFSLLRREQPGLIVSAGGFISVPLVWAAATKKIPILIHQQDVRAGLANKLMAPFARVVTVTFEKSLLDYGIKAIWIGNPVKQLSLADQELKIEAIKNKYSLLESKPLVLVVGGGTGSAAINNLIFRAASELSEFCQLLHLTGSGKLPSNINGSDYYRIREIVTHQDILELMMAAEVVVSRCGLASLTELSALNKPAILIPIPKSHQEDNAAVFSRAEAAIVLNQNELTSEKLTVEIKRILNDATLKEKLKNNISKVIKKGATQNLTGIIEEILSRN
ncbi:MAG: UDP-N-acetylglucosamine--N-acetylmuramyl-(pentapeptide) pyrophosphoryl-undecaprenol N-acetylglucosamine transferase [Patescibacteria group bacterium]|jgi:UDP-N-acetylglucosamine--N-acetylmuramyl-(pentapeptide) pyrophosphoryl-undecaprenol N-acetylglucosamine transferase